MAEGTMKYGWLAPCAVSMLFGCGGAVDRPVAEFPSKEQLLKLAAQPAHPSPPLATVPVDRWTFASKVPAPGAPYPVEDPWDRMIVAGRAAASSQTRLSPELRCAAQEAARFYVENGASPEDALREYLVLRCGATIASSSMRSLTAAVPDDVTEPRFEDAYRKDVHQLVDEVLKGGSEAGLGFARGRGRAAFFAFYGTPTGRLSAVPGLVQGSEVTLEGEAEPRAAFVMGIATKGKLGVSLCEPDSTVPAPAFRLRCPIADGDAQTRIDIEMRLAGDVLLRGSMHVLVRRDADAGLVYEAKPYGATEPSPNADAFRSALATGLNTARAEAGARAVEIEANESHDSDSLVAQYFDSSIRGDTQAVDTVALGLMAGWDVGGTIRGGAFYSQLTAGSRSPGRWLAYALESPTGRWSLLEPSMARIAIGTGLVGHDGVMALVSTYSFFESSDHHPDEDAVFESLVRARKERGLPAPTRAPSDTNLDRALSQILINASTCAVALHDAMEHVAYVEHRAVRGMYVETSDLKQLPFGDDLLAKGPVDVQVGVTHHKAPGGAWGQYAVLFLIRGQPPSDTKEARAKHRQVATREARAGR
jgi:hypothetical protein